MKVASVSYVSFFDNILNTKMYKVEDSVKWKDALLIAAEDGLLGDTETLKKWIEMIPDDLLDAKSFFRDGDSLIDVSFLDI